MALWFVISATRFPRMACGMSARNVSIPGRTTAAVSASALGAGAASGSGAGSGWPVAAAIANAIFNAVGVRMRHLPISPDAVLKALKA